MIFLIILLGTTLAKNTCHITTIQMYTPKMKTHNSTSTLEDQEWDDEGTQIIDMDSSVVYEKDIHAVSGSTSTLEDEEWDDEGIQIIDMDSSVVYEKDINAVSGYIDTRGTWRPY